MNVNMLNEPYPKLGNPWRIIGIVSIFIALFLFVFEPFGLSGVPGSIKIWVLLGYGAVTGFALFLNLIVLQILMKSWFKSEKWTVLREIVFLLWVLFCVGTGNYWYTNLFFNAIGSFALFQLYTLSIGIIPVVGITLISQNVQLRNNYKKAEDLNALLLYNLPNEKGAKTPIALCSETGKTEVELDLMQLLYLESDGNYVNVHYIEEEKEMYTLIRISLKGINEQLSAFSQMVKCHRAYMVNISHVYKVTGNAQGLILSLKHTNDKVPVSRSYVSVVRSVISAK